METDRAVVLVTDTARGGTPLRLAAVARGLRERGWEIMVVSVMPGGPVLADLAADGFATASLGARSWATAPVLVPRFRRIIRSSRAQVVQTALWHANIIGRVAAVGTGIPVVSGYQSTDPRKSLPRVALDRITAPLAARHVVVSEAVADAVVRRERLPRDRVDVIPLGRSVATRPRVDRQTARAALGLSDGPMVGWVGRLHDVKDVPTLIRALPMLPGWTAVIVGDGPERGHLDALASDLSVGDRVVMAGETDDVTPWLDSFDVFCLTSKWEGFPGALLEAMAAGLPVVATAVGGVTELVRDGETGILITSGDPARLATAVLEAARRPELGVAAATDVAARFRESDMVDGYDDVWRRVAKGGGR